MDRQKEKDIKERGKQIDRATGQGSTLEDSETRAIMFVQRHVDKLE